jgi:hypothetical protein
MTTEVESRSRTAESPAGAGLGPPSAVPRRLVLVGLLAALTGAACLLSVLVRGVLLGVDAAAASSDAPVPLLPLGVGLALAGGLLVHAGSLFVRADRRPR